MARNRSLFAISAAAYTCFATEVDAYCKCCVWVSIIVASRCHTFPCALVYSRASSGINYSYRFVI